MSGQPSEIYRAHGYKLKLTRGVNVFVIYDQVVIPESGFRDRIRWHGKAVDEEIAVLMDFIVAEANLLIFRKERYPYLHLTTVKEKEPVWLGRQVGDTQEMVLCDNLEFAIGMIMKVSVQDDHSNTPESLQKPTVVGSEEGKADNYTSGGSNSPKTMNDELNEAMKGKR